MALICKSYTAGQNTNVRHCHVRCLLAIIHLFGVRSVMLPRKSYDDVRYLLCFSSTEFLTKAPFSISVSPEGARTSDMAGLRSPRNKNRFQLVFPPKGTSKTTRLVSLNKEAVFNFGFSKGACKSDVAELGVPPIESVWSRANN